jgi:carbamoyl-phosphate synthase small subunit
MSTSLRSSAVPAPLPALLCLADGSTFRGVSIGAPGEAVGEVVFNTAICGYQEILTDPSYCRQIVTLTYPHVGNVGANPEDEESQGLFASGLIVREVPTAPSNWRSREGLPEYLQRRGLVAIAQIDTRRLTRLLREKGAQGGCIQAGQVDPERARAQAGAFAGLGGMDLARVVSTTGPYEWTRGSWSLSGEQAAPRERFHVVAYDFGVKRNILRMLADRGCRVSVVPAQTPAQEVLAMAPDGVFLSNGPGDPEPCAYAIEAIRTFLSADRRLPLFGICLGHQLMALASGARTLKMKFGHHGANHPVRDLETGRVVITSQNHGFAVDPATVPADRMKVTHTSLFDGSIQGLARTERPAFSFQGHPEASPGPHDIGYLFDRFAEMMAHA